VIQLLLQETKLIANIALLHACPEYLQQSCRFEDIVYYY